MTEQFRGSADLVGEFQRWLIRSSAKGMSRGVGDQLRSAFGGVGASGDVWKAATADPSPAHAPDCGWCPVCRAARMMRESGPGLVTQVSAAGDVLTALLSEAVSAAESALAGVSRMAANAGSAAHAEPDAEPAREKSPAGAALDRAPDEPDDRG